MATMSGSRDTSPNIRSTRREPSASMCILLSERKMADVLRRPGFLTSSPARHQGRIYRMGSNGRQRRVTDDLRAVTAAQWGLLAWSRR